MLHHLHTGMLVCGEFCGSSVTSVAIFTYLSVSSRGAYLLCIFITDVVSSVSHVCNNNNNNNNVFYYACGQRKIQYAHYTWKPYNKLHKIWIKAKRNVQLPTRTKRPFSHVKRSEEFYKHLRFANIVHSVNLCTSTTDCVALILLYVRLVQGSGIEIQISPTSLVKKMLGWLNSHLHLKFKISRAVKINDQLIDRFFNRLKCDWNFGLVNITNILIRTLPEHWL